MKKNDLFIFLKEGEALNFEQDEKGQYVRKDFIGKLVFPADSEIEKGSYPNYYLDNGKNNWALHPELAKKLLMLIDDYEGQLAKNSDVISGELLVSSSSADMKISSAELKLLGEAFSVDDIIKLRKAKLI